MTSLKDLKESKTASRARGIISSKLKTMEFLKKGGITKREQPELEKAHKELDDVIHDRFGKRPEEMKESKMAELDDNIRSHFPDKYNVEIGKSSIHTHKNHNGERKYVVHPVTYYKDPETHATKYGNARRQQYQTYVHHEFGSTEVKKGLPPRLGGDIRSVK